MVIVYKGLHGSGLHGSLNRDKLQTFDHLVKKKYYNGSLKTKLKVCVFLTNTPCLKYYIIIVIK